MIKWLLGLTRLQQTAVCQGRGVEAEVRLERGRVNRVTVTVARHGSLVREVTEWGWMDLKLRIKTGWSPVPMSASELERLMWRVEDEQRDRLLRRAMVAGAVVLGALAVTAVLTGRLTLSALVELLLVLIVLGAQGRLRKRLSRNSWGAFIVAVALPVLMGLIHDQVLPQSAFEWWVIAFSALPLIPIHTPWDGDWDPQTSSWEKVPRWRTRLGPLLVWAAIGLYIWLLLA